MIRLSDLLQGKQRNIVTTSSALDPITENVVRTFLAEVKSQYDVAAAFVFGSQARGDATPGSDTDVAILLHGLPASRMSEAMNMADIAYDIMLRTGIRVEARPLWETEWEHPETFNNPDLIENIRREGVRL